MSPVNPNMVGTLLVTEVSRYDEAQARVTLADRLPGGKRRVVVYLYIPNDEANAYAYGSEVPYTIGGF